MRHQNLLTSCTDIKIISRDNRVQVTWIQLQCVEGTKTVGCICIENSVAGQMIHHSLGNEFNNDADTNDQIHNTLNKHITFSFQWLIKHTHTHTHCISKPFPPTSCYNLYCPRVTSKLSLPNVCLCVCVCVVFPDGEQCPLCVVTKQTNCYPDDNDWAEPHCVRQEAAFWGLGYPSRPPRCYFLFDCCSFSHSLTRT